MRLDSMMPCKPGRIRMGCVLALGILESIGCIITVGADDQGIRRVDSPAGLEKRSGEQYHHHHLQEQSQVYRDQRHAAKTSKTKSHFKALTSRRRSHHHKSHKGHKVIRRKHTSFGVLVCDSKTVSAVYCPTGTMKRPSSLKSHPEIYTAEKNSMKQSHRKNGEYGKSLAYMNMISMDMPCPKPISKDTENVLSQLTCQDLTIVEKEFNLDFYSNAIPARDRSKMTVQFVAPHSHQSVVWIQMLCIVASVSTRTLRLSVVVTQNGEDPKLVFDCASGSYKAGRSVCDPDKCVCSVTDSTVCGPEFLPECNLDSRLYTFMNPHSQINAISMVVHFATALISDRRRYLALIAIWENVQLGLTPDDSEKCIFSEAAPDQLF
ncbi:hypothetical protein BGZ79_001229 [Entomortierella chlamydospora]|nr:hypothetical protein BGZ79_001229 [Entomortierella chlamydospora]